MRDESVTAPKSPVWLSTNLNLPHSPPQCRLILAPHPIGQRLPVGLAEEVFTGVESSIVEKRSVGGGRDGKW